MQKGTQQVCALRENRPSGFGVDQHVRLVRLERLEARLEDVESVVSDIQTPWRLALRRRQRARAVASEHCRE